MVNELKDMTMQQAIEINNAIQPIIENLPSVAEAHKLEVGDFAKVVWFKSSSSLVKIVRMKWFSPWSCQVTYVHVDVLRRTPAKGYYTCTSMQHNPTTLSKCGWLSRNWFTKNIQFWEFGTGKSENPNRTFNAYGDILPVQA